MGNELTIIEQQLLPMEDDFAEALAGIMPAKRLIRTICVSMEKSPTLLDCSKQSVINSAMTAAVLGLEVDGATGQAFLIPFKNKCQLVIGYKGFNTIGARAGLTITGDVVREGDEFDFDEGEGFVRFKRSLAPTGDRRIIAAWAKAAAINRPSIVTVLSIDDILAVKKKSPGARKPDSPWNDETIGFPAMAAKTVKRRLARSTPLSVYSLGAALDEAVEERGKAAWIKPDRTLMIEGEAGAAAPEESPTPKAEDLTARRSQSEIVEELEAIAVQDGMKGLVVAWRRLHRSEQEIVGKSEITRIENIASGGKIGDGNQKTML